MIHGALKDIKTIQRAAAHLERYVSLALLFLDLGHSLIRLSKNQPFFVHL